MFRLSTTQANIYALLVFLFTILLSYSLPEHTISYTGFLLVIFFSVFVKGRQSTIIAAVTGVVLVFGFLLFHPSISITTVNVTKHIFVILLIFFYSPAGAAHQAAVCPYGARPVAYGFAVRECNGRHYPHERQRPGCAGQPGCLPHVRLHCRRTAGPAR